MGLGIVELILATEDRFGVTIPNSALADITTVGDLVGLIVRLSGEQPAESGKCRTSRAFFRLRRILVGDPDIKPASVRPSVTVSELVLPSQRRALWKRLGHAGIRLPSLELPKPLAWLLGISAVGSFLSCLLLFGVAVRGAASWRLAMCLSPPWLVFVGLRKLATPLRNRIPANCATLGDIAAFLALDASVVGALPAEDVMLETRELIHLELGVPLDRILPESRLIEDLRAG